MELTNHAEKRMQQRGRSEGDIALITSYGTQTRDGYLLRNRDADQRIHALKKEIGRIERLKGWAVITAEKDVVVSVYPADRRKQRKMIHQFGR